jgi:hypothetical protein
VDDEDCFSIELDLSPESGPPRSWPEQPPQLSPSIILEALCSSCPEQQWQGLTLVETNLGSSEWLASFTTIGVHHVAVFAHSHACSSDCSVCKVMWLL